MASRVADLAFTDARVGGVLSASGPGRVASKHQQVHRTERDDCVALATHRIDPA
ncbi:MAG: hypothetical protein K0U79_01235 [Gammaproteobacteria bacterium]|nr:hypothetical protein [Gammaproteobacteria bacterium]